MLGKILTIAWTHIYIVFRDRGALILMLLTPIAVSTMVALAFGEDPGDIDLQPAQVMVINQDEGAETTQGETNWGQQLYVDVLTENDPNGLGDVLQGKVGDVDIETARQQVEDGEIDALVVIPPTFSANVVSPDGVGQVEVYYNPGDSVAASIILSVIKQLTSSLNAGQVAENILVGGSDSYFVQKSAGDFSTIGTAAEDVLTNLYSRSNEIGVTLDSVSVKGEAQSFDSLQYFAPSMAILFMSFAMAAGMRGILDEYQNWTLQRIVTTPTPRWVYMLGKMLGTYATGLIQMSILLIITPLVALVLGRSGNIWGDNYLGIVLITMAVVAAASGLGLLLAAFSKTPRQAESVASAVVLLMGVIGGTFIPVENVAVLDALSNISLNHWGIKTYTDLAVEHATLNEILPAIGVLVAMAAIYFGIALWRFNRRLDI